MRFRCALLFLAATLLWAAPTLPDTPAGHRFGEWLEVINRGDRSELLKFFSGDTERADRSIALRQQSGGFELEKIEESAPTSICGILKSRGPGRLVRFAMQVQPEAPHRIVTVQLRPAAGLAAEAPVQRMGESQALDALRVECQRLASRDEFAGAVLVAKDGESIFERAYGLADREKNIPNKAATKFRIGSMNKMFTAVAVAQLAQEGKLAFEDPLGKWIPDYPNKEVSSKVTIHHLLTHTGGTGDIFGPAFDAHRSSMRELKDYVDLYGGRGLKFAPGSKWSYSNYGFILLGRIVEKASGQSYYDYVREYIYKPAGMTSTDSFPESMEVPGRSVGYTKNGGSAWSPNTNTLPPRGTSAGGGYATVEDLLRFANALTANKLLNARYTELVTTGKVDTTGPGKYAYGFGDNRQGGVRWFGHGGGAPGMNGDLRIYPDSGYAVAVLSNEDPPAATNVGRFIGDRLPAH